MGLDGVIEWVLKYPEARVKIAFYTNVKQELEAARTAMNDELSARPKSSFKDSGLNGDYYDKYYAQIAVWYQEFDDLLDKFSVFEQQLDQCIINAQSKIDEWIAKADIREYL